MSDLTTRSREAAQRDIAVAALRSILHIPEEAVETASGALARIAEIEAPAPAQAQPRSALERAVDFLWPCYRDENLPKMEFAAKSPECQRLAREFEQAERWIKRAATAVAAMNRIQEACEQKVCEARAAAIEAIAQHFCRMLASRGNNDNLRLTQVIDAIRALAAAPQGPAP